MGGFFGAALVFLNYYDGIKYFSNGQYLISGSQATAGIFATYPKGFITVYEGVFDQILGTMIFLIGIFMVTDEYNFRFKAPDICFFVSLMLFVIGISLGFNSGYAINPARDLGPRVFTSFIYGWEVFSESNYWFWIPTFMPFIGAILGGYFYNLAIGSFNYRKSIADTSISN